MPSSAVGIRLPPSCSHGVLGGIAWTKWLMMLTGESLNEVLPSGG